MVMSLLERTIENTPMNEARIRGMNTQTVTSSDLSRMQAVLFLSMLKANNGADFVAVVKLNNNGRYDITVPEGIIYA